MCAVSDGDRVYRGPELPSQQGCGRSEGAPRQGAGCRRPDAGTEGMANRRIIRPTAALAAGRREGVERMGHPARPTAVVDAREDAPARIPVARPRPDYHGLTEMARRRHGAADRGTPVD